MINQKLYKIEKENAFSRSSRLVSEYRKSHPEAEIISLGIGDVSFPVVPEVIEAMKKACDEQASMEHFQGYGAYWGIESLRRCIAENDYAGLDIGPEEIYVGDGTKTDSTAILELLDTNSRILTGNPMYPIYQNGAYALGRDVCFAERDDEFKMVIPKEHYDIVYICSPCNPVGNAYTGSELKGWIKYANREGALIVYDNVYIDFAESEGVPKSIYEIPGSRSCCVEMRSYSKNASFSGTRCSYFVLPKEFGPELHELWRERTINRFNGASIIAQKGAEASYLPSARAKIKKQIEVYKANARELREALSECGFDVIGGTDAPYLWVQTPDKKECWEAFEFFLEVLNIVVVPGSIFGSEGKYRLRISSLGTPENTRKAIERIKSYYEKGI